MRSLGGELAQHVFIRELAAAECGVRQVVLAGGLMTLTSAGAPPTSCMITGRSPGHRSPALESSLRTSLSDGTTGHGEVAKGKWSAGGTTGPASGGAWRPS